MNLIQTDKMGQAWVPLRWSIRRLVVNESGNGTTFCKRRGCAGGDLTTDADNQSQQIVTNESP